MKYSSRAVGLLMVALAAAAPVARAETPKAGTVVLEAATAKLGDGTPVAYERGTLYVLENRAAPKSRVIPVRFARIKAARTTQAPPIIHLPGGPGASYMHAFTGARGEWSLHRLAMYVRYSAVADVLTLDQRGNSKDLHFLQAPSAPARPLDRPSTVQGAVQGWIAYARALQAANPGADLAGYNIAECAADVDELRRALGYTKVSLLGESFGSQWSFAVMRLHPGIVARAMLGGVEPLDDGFDLPSDTFAAMQRIAFDADRDAKLAPYLPAGGLMAAVRELRDRFARSPVTVRVTDPKTGKTDAVVLGLEDLQSALVPDDAKTWPAHILSLYHGRYQDWAASAIADRRAPTLFPRPVNPLIDSGLGVTAARSHRLHTDPATHYLGTWSFAPHQGSRAAWPTPDLGDALRTPSPSHIPVVFINGTWDTSTGVENMLRIAPYFPNSRSIIVHRGVHDVGNDPGEPSWRPVQRPEIFAAFLEFFRSGATAKLPTEFSLPVPAFAVPAFPPPPKPKPKQ